MENHVEIKARLMALRNRLIDIEEKDKQGMLDDGRILKLKSSIETELFILLDQLGKNIQDDEITDIFKDIRSNPENAKENLEKLAEKKGWQSVKDAIAKHQGAIISLLITATIKILEAYSES